MDEAKKFLKEQGGWSHKAKYENSEGVKYQYRCRRECKKTCYIMVHADNTECTIYESDDLHEIKNRGLDEACRKEVASLFEKGTN